MTSTTSTAASASVTQTFSIARLDEQASRPSRRRSSCLRAGSARTCSAIALAASATASVLAPDWRTMPRPTAGLPLSRNGDIGIFRALLDPGDVAEADQIAVGAAADDELRGTARRVANGRSTRSVTFCCADSSRPAGSSTFCVRERGLDVGRGQAEGGEPLGPDPDPHRRPRLAADEDPGDAVDRGEAVDAGCGRPSRDSCSRDQPGLETTRNMIGEASASTLRTSRRLDLGRQVAGRGADPVAHVVGGAVDVAARR